MARSPNNAVRHRFFLPVTVLHGLQAQADEDETPVAELIRRMVDYAVTMKIPPPNILVPAAHPHDVPKDFTVIIPQRLLDQLGYEAADRGVSPHELIRQTSVVYLKQRKRALSKWYVDAA